MVAHKCTRCSIEAPDAKRCAGCKSVWYCSTECQKHNWPLHIFDCKTDKPIDTAYHLARACFASNGAPFDEQTQIDYGFDVAARTLGATGHDMVCKLWTEVLVDRAVSPHELRKWRKEGRLLQGIKGVFEVLPPDSRGPCYPWLLEHQWLLDGSPVNEAVIRQSSAALVDKMTRDAWAFIGGSSEDTDEEVTEKIRAFPLPRRLCFYLYAVILSQAQPHPSSPTTQEMWMEFGFVAGKEEERAHSYRELMRRCTFDEFCAAFETSTILVLFYRYRVPVPGPRHFLDVMAGSPRSFKSVWYLRLYIVRLVSAIPGDTPTPARLVSVDYGFANCKNDQERKLLDDLYKRMFFTTEFDPLDLHEACMRGQLLEHARGLVKLAPNTAKYTRLLKNLYPLRGL